MDVKTAVRLRREYELRISNLIHMRNSFSELISFVKQHSEQLATFSSDDIIVPIPEDIMKSLHELTQDLGEVGDSINYYEQLLKEHKGRLEKMELQ